MKYLWTLWLPLLYLPSLGMERPTPFGTLEISDYLILPYIVLLIPAAKFSNRGNVDYLALVLGVFLYWAFFSTLSVSLRYNYESDQVLLFGILKLGKLSLYGLAGLLTSKALSDEGQQKFFRWSLLMAGLIVSISLLVAPEVAEGYRSENVLGGYKGNVISVIMAMLICYVVGLWMTSQGSLRWRFMTMIILSVMILGFFVTRGRGGWIAALVGTMYLIYRKGMSFLVFACFVGLTVLISLAYTIYPKFEAEVNKTLWPDKQFLERYNAGVAGVDDGSRIATWTHEAAKFIDAPVFGTGFFHRGGRSGLWPTGSHNFWLQMFLETGFFGGSLMLIAMWIMWFQAGSTAARSSGQELPLRSALIAAFVSGLSESYFYGGMVLFTLLIIYCSTGALAKATTNRGI